MSDDPICDQRTFFLLCDEIGAEDVQELLASFFADTRKKISLCAASESDRALIRRETHAIKSSAAMFGFVELYKVALNIEKLALTTSKAELERQTSELRQSFQEAVRFAETSLPARAERFAT